MEDVRWHPTRSVLATVSDNGRIYLWARVCRENWSAFAPDFEELDENKVPFNPETPLRQLRFGESLSLARGTYYLESVKFLLPRLSPLSWGMNKETPGDPDISKFAFARRSLADLSSCGRWRKSISSGRMSLLSDCQPI